MRARVQYRRSRFSRVEENRESRVGRIERRKYSGEIGSKGGNNLLRPRFLRERARKEKFRRFRIEILEAKWKKKKGRKKKRENSRHNLRTDIASRYMPIDRNGRWRFIRFFLRTNDVYILPLPLERTMISDIHIYRPIVIVVFDRVEIKMYFKIYTELRASFFPSAYI